MANLDVPMYITRFLQDNGNAKTYASCWSFLLKFLPFSYLTIEQGISDIKFCKNVTQIDNYWLNEVILFLILIYSYIQMPWMSGYFTLGVWSSIILGL
jgi:hypothetical protein